MPRPLMLLGTMSGVGKSTVAAGLCRCFSDAGYRTAPFKALNLASTAARLQDGSLIGSGQAVQAAAARTTADARMNPLLILYGGGRSRRLLRGRERDEGWACDLRAEAAAAFRELSGEYEQMILEGSGSCCELNLLDGDVANGWMAETADAAALLIADVERGGVFAQVCGTLSLLPEDTRRRVGGVIVNRFRGDPAEFEDGARLLEERAGVPMVGILPWRAPELPEEDGADACNFDAGTLSSPAMQVRYDALAGWLRRNLDMTRIRRMAKVE